jgi:vancomycin resistance protein YoaR
MKDYDEEFCTKALEELSVKSLTPKQSVYLEFYKYLVQDYLKRLKQRKRRKMHAEQLKELIKQMEDDDSSTENEMQALSYANSEATKLLVDEKKKLKHVPTKIIDMRCSKLNLEINDLGDITQYKCTAMKDNCSHNGNCGLYECPLHKSKKGSY